jgi:site-specific recombinase
MRDLPSLLDAMDPQASQVQRHLWLVDLLDWIRGQDHCAPDAVARIHLFIHTVQAQPALQMRLQAWWQTLISTLDGSTLLADHGFAQRPAIISEFFARLLRKILPQTPQTRDSSELFSLLFPDAFDAEWLALLDAATAERLAQLLGHSETADLTPWQHVLMEAITYCVSQVRATGFAPELRLRMSAPLLESQAFHTLATDFDAVQTALRHTPRDEATVDKAVHHFKERLDACRHAASSVYTHLDEHGISVDLVFRLRQLRERVLRIRALLDCLLSPTRSLSATLLMSHLVLVGLQNRSIRALIASNSSLLAAKVTDRSAETGETYITRNATEYRDMLRKSAGGGAVVALTTLMKYLLLLLGLSAFWGGFFSGLNYALSFVLIQLLHWTLATKQPAMTAPAMAAKLKDLGNPDAVRGFVDEVCHLVRSQFAAVLGNLALVVPCVLLLGGAYRLLFGHFVMDAHQAAHVFDSLTLLGPTAFFAALTGVLLFASSIVAGWVENWFVLHRLDSALRYNPRITTLLGVPRAARWAHFMRGNISGLAANISLGLMLGLLPAFATFFGLGLEVRHVTLSAGQLALACANLGVESLKMPAFWWAVVAVPVIGIFNVSVSFYFAFRLALRAHNVSGLDRARIRSAIWARVGSAPLSFVWPGPDLAGEDSQRG